MKKNVYLLLGVVLLYLIPSLILSGIYGPSYGFMSGEDSWIPDGHGGWVQHGKPTDPAPTEPSVEVPVAVRYIPIFLPGLLLILFLYTPLGKKLEAPKPVEPAPTEPIELPPGQDDSGVNSSEDSGPDSKS